MYSIPMQVCISEACEFNIKQQVNPFSKESQQARAVSNRVRHKDYLPAQGSFEEVPNPPRAGWRFAGITGHMVILKAPFTLNDGLPVYIMVEQHIIELLPPNTDVSEVEWQFICPSDNSVMLMPLTVLNHPSMAKFLISNTSIKGDSLTRADVGKILKRQGVKPVHVLVVPEHDNSEGVLLLTNKGHMYPAGVFEYTGESVSEQSLDTVRAMMDLRGRLYGIHPESTEWPKFRSLDEELLQLWTRLDSPFTITLCESSPQPAFNPDQEADTYVRTPLKLPLNTKITSTVNQSRMALISGDNVHLVKVQFTKFRNGIRVSLGVRSFYQKFGTDGAYVLKMDFKSASETLTWVADLLKENPTLGVLTLKVYEQYYAYNTDTTLI